MFAKANALFAAACLLLCVDPAMAGNGSIPDHNQTGMATYYSDARQNQHTASGERFDQAKMTAAHPSLPLGAWVRVTNLLNGRSVNVRINDRKAESSTYIIDLSQAAARAVGMIRAGLARVKVERILPPASRITMREPPHKPEYRD